MSKLIIPQFNLDDESNAQCLLVWADLVSSFNALNHLPDENRMEICKSLIHLLDDKIEKQTSQSYIGSPVVPATVAITSIDVAPVEDKKEEKPVEETPPPADDKPAEEEKPEDDTEETDDEDEDAKGDDVKDAVKKVEKAAAVEDEDDEEDDEYYESVATCRLSSDPMKVKKSGNAGVTLMVEDLTISKSTASFKIGDRRFETLVERNNLIHMNVFVNNKKLTGTVKLGHTAGSSHFVVGAEAYSLLQK